MKPLFGGGKGQKRDSKRKHRRRKKREWEIGERR